MEREKVPGRYRTDPRTAALLDALGEKGADLAALVDDLILQIFPTTATWGLTLWEKQLGLTAGAGQSLDERRAAINAKRAASGNTTQAAISALVKSVTGYACKVTVNGDYSFSIRFYGDQEGFIHPDIPALKAALETAKPAHLAAVIQPVTWKDIEDAKLTWAQLEVEFSSWEELESAVYCRKAE